MLGVFAYFLVAPFASQICSVFSNFWAATPLGDIWKKRILCIEPCFCIALSRFGVNSGGNRVGIGWIFFRSESSPLISGKNTHLFFINQQCFFLHVIYRHCAVHAHCRLPFWLLLCKLHFVGFELLNEFTKELKRVVTCNCYLFAVFLLNGIRKETRINCCNVMMVDVR